MPLEIFRSRALAVPPAFCFNTFGGTEMKDIRQDLRERLDAIAAQRADLQLKIATLLASETGLKMLLRDEEERFAREPRLFPDKVAVNGTSLRELIEKELRDKRRPMTVEDFKTEILRTTYNFGESKPGRAIQGALMGLKQNGVIDQLGEGQWVLKELVDRQQESPN